MTKLVDLEAEFIRYNKPGHITRVLTLAEADGVMFLCPKCETHTVICWFRDRLVPVDESPAPGRWTPSGADIHDLTLSPSINLLGEGCRWHGFVRNGDAT
ncbi:hypothetical protein Rctr197k_187 [Virus Rctr197k]|nr:hypothetical protein Rctr197k_187 [Virus Rctr197k]